MCLLLVIVIAVLKDFYLLTLKFFGFPSDPQILREVCKILFFRICKVFIMFLLRKYSSKKALMLADLRRTALTMELCVIALLSSA